jgi:hypothetical protein
MALWLSCTAASSIVRCFYSDCDTKLFGTTISNYLIGDGSKVEAAPAKHQSSNGPVESYWKVMVHMDWAYLTEKQIPQTLWFYAISYVACTMNTIPGQLNGHLASPFLLVHDIGHDK